jgi:putative copper export protein
MSILHMSGAGHLAGAIDSLRLFLHVISATIWVGGQFTLAALVPVLKQRDLELPKKVARKFNQIAWPAFGLLVITGAWNLSVVSKGATANYHAVIAAKMLAVALSGGAAYLHTQAKSTKSLAIWGALSGLAAISATYLGVLLAG